MGDAFIPGFGSATLQLVLERLWDFMVREVGLLLDANEGFKKLERTLLRVQAMLDDVEHKEISHRAWKIWLRDLKDAAYEADDLLDEIAMSCTSSSTQQVNLSSFPSFKPHKMDSIQKKVDEIAREMEFLYMSKLVGSTQITTKERPPTGSLLMEEERSFIGRKDEKNKIIEYLTSETDNVDVASLVGMAGIGKTTLAQVVYNAPNISDHFESRMWVSVNNDFDVKRITKSMIESVSHSVVDLMNLDPLQVTLSTLLANKKFLLVLDDVWSENYNDWDVLRAPLRVGAPGSKILITTRSQTVSKITMSSHVLILQTLSYDDSLLLFMNRAFRNRNPSEIPPNLISIGEEIARKCRGLPLVAKTLGSLLNSVASEDQWKTVLRSEIWDFQEDESTILPALRLSYQYLPSNLKQCFAYCAVFPRGYKFEKETLVLLWMAQGFIQAKGSRRMEDVGSDYFDILMNKSFFQKEPALSVDPPRYVMHDLIHDLAKFVSGEECLGMEVGGDAGLPYISRNVRHLSFLKGNISTGTYDALYRCQSIRTILLSGQLNHYSIHDVPFKIFTKLNCLRVLDLSMTRIKKLPSSIGNLKHLRYLDISKTQIKELDKGLCSLYSLQTLKVKECELLGLPRRLSHLTNLRHLDLEMNFRMNSMPPGMGKLTDLQTLSTFVVSVDDGCQISELKSLRNLSGTLCISKLENVPDIQEASQASLNDKPHLRKLKLIWRGDTQEANVEKGVLAGLRPHQNLEELHIVYYSGAVFPRWVTGSTLSNLLSLTLENCPKCFVLPPLGQLPTLKSLVITNMPSVESIDRGFCGTGDVQGFPSLETLKLHNMANFLSWDGLVEGNVVPRLRKLMISSCVKLEVIPNIQCFLVLEHFAVSNCSKLPMLSGEVPLSLRHLSIAGCALLKGWYDSEGCSGLKERVRDLEVTIDGLRRS